MNTPATTTRSAPASLSEPPGGVFIWMLVTLEIITFGIALISLAASAKADPGAYHQSRLLLNPGYGIINTLFLLTSGYFMAEGTRHFRAGARGKARRSLWLTVTGGLLFLILKGIEYSEKIGQGHTLGSDPFFTWYWLLTVFHLMHVIVGLVILACLLHKLTRISEEDLEAGGIFWHMCDLIWLLLFPALYLIL